MEFKFLENLGREFRDTVLRLLRDYSESLFLALIMAFILRLFVFTTYKISNPVMEPNLKLGDFIVGYKLPYGFNLPFFDSHYGQTTPRRGDLLIFKCPKTPELSCVRRVAGISGDRIEIRGQRLLINGRVAKYVRSNLKPSIALKGPEKLVAIEEKITGNVRAILISDKDELGNFGPYIVPPESFFALGDNRDFSEDSRHWGAVPNNLIESRAIFVWLSIEWLPQQDGSFTSRLRWERLFSLVK
ncbi:MAG: signal peptidase I [Bdellovibrionales bacterium RBG_16_40_8]|nr:MAG: signal peptidase I [Bdellovibrionales bacterium RBG_16_40_8]